MVRNEKNINSFLNVVPFICAALVICLHSYTAGDLPASSIGARVQGFLCHGVCMLAVPVFMFMSGFLFFRNITSVKDVFKKQLKRIKTLVIPFVAWSALYYLLFLVANNVLDSVVQNPVDVSFLGIVRGVIFYEYCFPLWYLFQMILFTLLTPLVYMILKSKTASICMIAAMAILTYADYGEIEIVVSGAKKTLFYCGYFGYFLVGCLLGSDKQGKTKLTILARKLPTVLIIVLFAMLCFVESLLFDGLITSFYPRMLVPVIFALGMALLLKLTDHWHVPKVQSCSTMVIYGVHTMVGLFVGKMIGQFLPSTLKFAALFLLTMVVSAGISFLIKRWLKPLHAIFSGFR